MLGDQVVRAAPAGQVPGVGALGVQGVRGDHRPGQADTVQQDGEHRDLIRLRRNIDLPQDHAADVIEGGQQMPGRLPACAGPAQRLAVDRDHPPPARRRGGALLGPGTGRVIQCVSVQVLQGPPECRLARHHAGDPERIPGGLISISGPLRDRGERPGPGQHRAHRQTQDHRQPMAHPAPCPRVGNRGQHRQQPRILPVQDLCGGQQLANRGGRSGMMAQRAWPLGSDRAGAGTAMITCGAVPAPLPAHIGVSQISRITASQDFADPLAVSARRSAP